MNACPLHVCDSCHKTGIGKCKHACSTHLAFHYVLCCCLCYSHHCKYHVGSHALSWYVLCSVTAPHVIVTRFMVSALPVGQATLLSLMTCCFHLSRSSLSQFLLCSVALPILRKVFGILSHCDAITCFCGHMCSHTLGHPCILNTFSFSIVAVVSVFSHAYHLFRLLMLWPVIVVI